MRAFLLLLCFSTFLLTSCGSSKPRVVTTKKEQRTAKEDKSEVEKTESIVFEKREAETLNKTASNITDFAIDFEGTPYKYGGTTKRGMDCSGLIYTAFQEEDVALPRTSRAMSLEGKRLRLNEVSIGDLLFFQTNKNRKVINHVGLVVEVVSGQINFIHSTTSRGVIVSSFNEAYWQNTFVMARRVI